MVDTGENVAHPSNATTAVIPAAKRAHAPKAYVPPAPRAISRRRVRNAWNAEEIGFFPKGDVFDPRSDETISFSTS